MILRWVNQIGSLPPPNLGSIPFNYTMKILALGIFFEIEP